MSTTGDDDPHRYCAEKLAASRSPAALALVFAPPAQRLALTAVHALELELRQVGERSSDPGVGRARSAWWAQEIAAAATEAPTHPVTRALVATLPREALARAGLDLALEATALAAAERPGEGYARAIGGASVRLSAAATGCGAALAAGAWSDELGGARLAVDVALAGGAAAPDPAAAARLRAAAPAVPAPARAHVVDQLVLAAIAARAAAAGSRPGALARLALAWHAARRARRSKSTMETT